MRIRVKPWCVALHASESQAHKLASRGIQIEFTDGIEGEVPFLMKYEATRAHCVRS